MTLLIKNKPHHRPRQWWKWRVFHRQYGEYGMNLEESTSLG